MMLRGGGYGIDFDFRKFRAPFAATRSFLNQIHQTKYCMVVQHNYEHFQEKKFFSDVPYWGNPRTKKKYFFEKSFTPKASQVAFLNIFSKIQKEVLENSKPHLSYLVESQISTQKHFSRTEISKHAACFDILVCKKYFRVKIRDST